MKVTKQVVTLLLTELVAFSSGKSTTDDRKLQIRGEVTANQETRGEFAALPPSNIKTIPPPPSPVLAPTIKILPTGPSPIVVTPTAPSPVALPPTTPITDPCFDEEIEFEGECNLDNIIGALESPDCPDPVSSLIAFFGGASIEDIIERICSSAHSSEAEDCMPHWETLQKAKMGDKEYYDGGEWPNNYRETYDEWGVKTYKLEYDGERIDQVFEDVAHERCISWPDYTSNFNPESCQYRAAYCCFVQDRQADDDNGNCKTPYDTNCKDADPADNTDICYHDMSVSQQSNRVRRGYSVFPEDIEGDAHCHGFAWSNDANHISGRFKGNVLQYVSMYDHLYDRGYVRNVPGAPMCACAEQMPVVSRSDCTQVDVEEESYKIKFNDATLTFEAVVENIEVEFNSCEGIDENGNNDDNDLESHYRLMVQEGKASGVELKRLQRKLVDDCGGPTKEFLARKRGEEAELAESGAETERDS